MKKPRHQWQDLNLDTRTDARSQARRFYRKCTRCHIVKRDTFMLQDNGKPTLFCGSHYRQSDGSWYYRNYGCKP